MWIMTPRGFYSAVQKPAQRGTPLLTVRARSRADLENLREFLPEIAPFTEDRWSDYPWRAVISVADWTKAVALMSTEVDYPNFKDEIKLRQGASRASVYSRVWGALLGIERERSAEVPHYSPTAFKPKRRQASLLDDYPNAADLGTLIDQREMMDEDARDARRPRGRRARR